MIFKSCDLVKGSFDHKEINKFCRGITRYFHDQPVLPTSSESQKNNNSKSSTSASAKLGIKCAHPNS